VVDATWDKVKSTADPAERNRLWKELNLYAIEQAYYFTFPAPFNYTLWQPWVKQYGGEVQNGRLWNWTWFAQICWVDKELESQMRK
jgi:peptide/nickel transport system substrate-binding protein